ncbi:hypothetical protein OPT61_g7135 [Boeremia exigua]|uniref:Uncharacterized protein n=1 Tax=Boeremia exigua TaxID=749465 RepID=A0ACC2I3F2_9PLEO|nr:hypothetical protein OPT61_g7135 [Boeremia exigua]
MVASARLLPADLAISDRSRKFYDGTYTWDSDGFTDEHGVYREFDFLDPLARAPTPMPPMFSDDEGDDDQADLTSGPAESTLPATAAIQPDVSTEPHGRETRTVSPRSPTSIRRFAIEFLANTTQNKTAASKHKHTVHTPEQAVPEKGLGGSHEQSGESPHAKDKESHVKLPETPPKTPVKAVLGAQTISPASTSSSLSSVPSNLSEEDRDGVRIVSAQSTPSLPNTPPTVPRSTAKTTTRGVAQKVTKASKKSVASKSSPPKKAEKSVEDFTLRDLHSGAFMRNGRRRSVRQARLGGN